MRAGSCVAIVGSSGAGKSTIGSLLMRYYEPDSGVVAVAAVDVSKTEHKHLHKLISVVSQEPVPFASSIKDNFRFAAPGAPAATI